MIKQRKSLPLLLGAVLYLVCFNSYAQQNRLKKSITINWDSDLPFLEAVSVNDNELLTILEEKNDAKLVYQFPLNSFQDFKYSIRNVEWKNDLSTDLSSLNEEKPQVVIASKKRFGFIEIPLNLKDNFNTYQPISFDLDIVLIKTSESVVKRRRADNSVLQSGDWYKFGIEATGVYKLTYEFLKSLGLEVDNIPVASYSVFGHYGGMLPKLAGNPRIDDLEEIPLSVASSSATLQPGDYLIFYGEGPHKWEYDASKNRFTHEKNLYADSKTYFITPNQGSGKRVSSVNSPSGVVDANYNSFNDRKFIEDDIINLNKSGSDWLGDEFKAELTKSYNFNFPNLVASAQAVLDYRVAARSSEYSGFSFNHNSNTIANANISNVDLNYYLGEVAKAQSGSANFNVSGNSINLTLVFNQPNSSAQGWLDFLTLNAKCNLSLSENSMAFRVIDSKNHNLVSYQLQNISASTKIWEVTDQFNIKQVNFDLSGSTATFKAEGNQINEYIAFNSVTQQPTAIGKINNQNLHGLSDADMIIITRPSLLQPANELAQFHADKEGLVSHVVTLDQVYNEFSAGTNDITAIRDFLKMFYDRSADFPKYALLFGDGTFNNKELGDYFIPTFQNNETLKTLDTYCSDDFFVFLDDSEGDNIDGSSNRLDMAIGRIPADNLSKGNLAVEKIKHYYSNASFGNWRNVGTYIADDEDGNLHFGDAEENSSSFRIENPSLNIEKIYLDAYNQVAGSGGGKYPDVNEAINKRMFKGNLFLNYIGHGGSNGLAEEGVVTLSDIESWDNPDKLPLFITATCEFTRYDDFDVYSAGERAFFRRDGGAIALVTTLRVVFASQNRQMNTSFVNSVTDAVNDRTLRLGDITKDSKNNSGAQNDGNRKFTLIGDPALRLAFPEFKVQTTKINDDVYQFSGGVLQTDTLKALTKITIEGEVRDLNDQLMTDFNGFVYPTAYDKVRTLNTLGNDPGSNIAPFEVQNNIIYAGKVGAVGGKFTYTFVVPKDINYTIGEGKISYYAHNDFIDAAGNDTVIVGGGGDLNPDSLDNEPPLVEVFIDDDTWISGDFTDNSPDLFIKLFDKNGINTVGSGIGHDIEAIIDNDNENSISLNDFYESDLNSYQSGTILYPIELIPTGTHDVNVKAWDVYNNSGEGFTEFVVAESADLALSHVLNYPNPFTTSTNFMLEHNRKGDVLNIRIEVFNVSGRLVKTLQQTEVSDSRNISIPWNGLDEFGDKIGKGVYIYKVSLKDSSGDKIEQFQKLVLLR